MTGTLQITNNTVNSPNNGISKLFLIKINEIDLPFFDIALVIKLNYM